MRRMILSRVFVRARALSPCLRLLLPRLPLTYPHLLVVLSIFSEILVVTMVQLFLDFTFRSGVLLLQRFEYDTPRGLDPQPWRLNSPRPWVTVSQRKSCIDWYLLRFFSFCLVLILTPNSDKALSNL